MGQPQKISNVLSQLLARRGYAREQSAAVGLAAWQQAAGEALAKHSRPGLLKRGVLEITVANSLFVQELSFQKSELLTRLNGLLPDEKIRDLRFRVGAID